MVKFLKGYTHQVTNVSKEEPQIVSKNIPDILRTVTELKNEGNRLVAMNATTLEETIQVDYVFDRDLQLRILRVIVGKGGEIPSISSIYFAAFVYENEIHDLFGITVSGNVLDYKGRFYRTAIKYPFVTDTNTDTNTGSDACQNE